LEVEADTDTTPHLFNPSDFNEELTSGEEIRNFLTKQQDKIVVIVWYRNEYGHWYLNRYNHEVRGTIINMIKDNYPNVYYHEIDMSEYNVNADTYNELSRELGIDLKMLYDAPIVLVLKGSEGNAFTTDKGSLALSKMVDQHLHTVEKKYFGLNTELSNSEEIMRQISQFPVPNVLDLEKKYQKQHSVKSKLNKSESPESQKQNNNDKSSLNDIPETQTTKSSTSSTTKSPPSAEPQKPKADTNVESPKPTVKPTASTIPPPVVQPKVSDWSMPPPAMSDWTTNPFDEQILSMESPSSSSYQYVPSTAYVQTRRNPVNYGRGPY